MKFNPRELDINQVGQWPIAVRAIFCAMAAATVVIVAWLLVVSGKRDELKGLEEQETQLREKYSVVAVRAANLEPLKAQMEQLQRSLKVAVRQLPSKTEMPNMVVDISQTALSSGLRNELFQPKPESVREFYAETPIDVRMVGHFHQFGQFVGEIASLPRLVIMTMQDITLVPRKGEKTINTSQLDKSALELTTTIKTYRYLDDDEAREQEAKAKEAERKSKAKKKAAKAKANNGEDA